MYILLYASLHGFLQIESQNGRKENSFACTSETK